MRFKLVIGESNWSFLTGGHCSEVVVKASLTVNAKNAYVNCILRIENGLFSCIKSLFSAFCLKLKHSRALNEVTV